MIESTWETINVPSNPIPGNFGRQLERELNQTIARDRNTTEFCKQITKLSERLEKEKAEILDALQAIGFFVMDDYYPNCATPPYKAAVGKMIATLEKYQKAIES